MSELTVKTCPNCRVDFTLQELVSSRDLEPVGMQIIDSGITRHVYYFNHMCPGCGTTFVVPVEVFEPFLSEAVPETPLAGSERCECHCLTLDDHAACGQNCRYAPYRRFLLRMRQRRAPVAEHAR